MNHFKELLLSEGTEEAAVIRDVLKKELGLSSRDVSVKASHGGTSSSVNVKVKTMKALKNFKRIKEVGEDQQYYDTDQATGEILAGGNTFIFVDLDYKFSSTLTDMINKEFVKQAKGSFEQGVTVTLYKTFNVYYMDDFSYIISLTKGGTTHTVQYQDGIAGGILRLIEKLEKPELYDKIK